MNVFQESIDNHGIYLWIEKESDDFKNSIARIQSPIYQNSRSDCSLRFRYFISGDLNKDYVTPAIHPVGSETEILLDYLTVTDEWRDHEIGIGRRRGQFQVMRDFTSSLTYDNLTCVLDCLSERKK